MAAGSHRTRRKGVRRGSDVNLVSQLVLDLSIKNTGDQLLGRRYRWDFWVQGKKDTGKCSGMGRKQQSCKASGVARAYSFHCWRRPRRLTGTSW